ncbi:hypothetical protein [Clostridium manihotivorum]|uniref:Uncharacterized protein n=1 Tax=Clostridium manihotivorum TaxID=2320868 RepID=A0A3R5V9U2_9CLOT|nr:hypothetical protein [Clostridium manihotivorum]QAA33416.1 hypothetical protein C1I91_18180 [Clostridium manihotivorum]
MDRLLKISYLNAKNLCKSKEFIIGLFASFAYSMLWVLVVHPPKYDLYGYSFEFGRVFFLIVLYMTVSVLRDDIRFNTTKTIFTGIFNRVEIMFSKAISLLILGVVFYVVAEINNILAALLLYSRIGISGFLSFAHWQLLIIYVITAFTMGSLMLLIAAFSFSDSKSVLFYIVFIAMINFYTAGVTMLLHRQPALKEKLWGYMITPFYNVVLLNQGYFNIKSVYINLLWAIGFILVSMIVVSRREIK